MISTLIRIVRPVCVAGAALCLTQPAWADDVDMCESGFYDRPAQLVACTAVIDQGLWPREDLAWVYSNRGNAHATLGEIELAIADYDAALRVDPDHARAYSNRGAAFYGQGQYDLAIADFDAALQRDLAPDLSFIAHYNRGLVYCRLGDLIAAHADWRRALNAVGARGRAKVQSLLAGNGYSPGSYDGIWTDASQAALDAWATDGCP